MHKHISNQRIPIIGHFELTHKCTYNCGFCYNNRDRQQKEMCLENILDIIDQISNEGCLFLNLSGGEPLIHKYFSEIYEYTANKGIHISIETNASYLSEKILNSLKEYPPIDILVSMYARTNSTQRKLTRSSIPLANVEHNINKLIESSLKVTLRTPVTKDNYNELDLLYRYAKTLGIPFKYDPKIWWNQSSERKHHYRCTSANIFPLRERSPIFEALYEDLRKLEKAPQAISKCEWGDKEFYINPYGELHYCIVFWATKYNLLNGSFKDAWKKWYKNIRTTGRKCVKIYPSNNQCPSGHIYFNKTITPNINLNNILFM